MIGYTNWAFLNDDAQKRFISTAQLKPEDWNSGDNVWHINTICVKNMKKIMSWTKKYFTNMLGLNQPVHWLRVDNNKKIYRKATRFTKESYK